MATTHWVAGVRGKQTDSTDPQVDDWDVDGLRSMYDGDEILQFRSEERPVRATKTGESGLPVTREIGAADATHSAAQRPVCRHQM